MPLELITDIPKLEDFSNLLKNNPGLLIIKFGAEWCGPCKKIEGLVNDWFSKMPDNVQPAIIDVDDCFELYGFLKSKKRVNGIPVILCYYKGNLNYISDDTVIGADEKQINLFFERCLQKCK
jgi:thiol-disulfide isomerase/thioredoxin